MSLSEEIEKARTEIVSDGYEMSVGELLNLYRDDELKINPAFQRLFRWDETQKTRFIESLLLGIPIPPIFVFQDESGVWELVDGLQRLSTIFQFFGVLRGDRAEALGPLVLEGTNYLPSLAGKCYGDAAPEVGIEIGQEHILQIKRARIRVEILKKESDVKAKYELFQRLNTGGAQLTPQEVRNAVAVMINKEFYDGLVDCASNPNFIITTDQTEQAKSSQSNIELALRFLSFRNIKYVSGLDVHEYLNKSLESMALDKEFEFNKEKDVFVKTFQFISEALGADAFKRWDGQKFQGKFLISVFEVMSTAISYNLDELSQFTPHDRSQFIKEKSIALWENDIFIKNMGGGVRGTTRLTNLLPLAKYYLDERPVNV